MIMIRLKERQEQILKIVQEQGPIIGEEHSWYPWGGESYLRPDFALLTKAGLLEARPRVGYYICRKANSIPGSWK